MAVPPSALCLSPLDPTAIPIRFTRSVCKFFRKRQGVVHKTAEQAEHDQCKQTAPHPCYFDWTCYSVTRCEMNPVFKHAKSSGERKKNKSNQLFPKNKQNKLVREPFQLSGDSWARRGRSMPARSGEVPVSDRPTAEVCGLLG